ncbi:MAG: ThuA domain-containing protein [Firmicutes bacterium]|nr:ThuA domain-containing protein [Bacillota bacterium]
MIKVTIWNEFRHEKEDAGVKAIYPDGIHGFIADFLRSDDIEVTLAALDDPDCGLPDEVLNNTDVLMWWGHCCHHLVPDALVEKIKNRVFNFGMGFIPMHSAHMSKPFRAIVGTSGNLLWGDEQKEIIWNIKPSHPIAEGVPEHIIIEKEEMYGEPFMIPEPDELVFSSWFEHGNIFRSGCCFYRGLGRIFYFQPGHESCRSFYDPNVQRILKNAVHWAAPLAKAERYPSSCDYYGKLV